MRAICDTQLSGPIWLRIDSEEYLYHVNITVSIKKHICAHIISCNYQLRWSINYVILCLLSNKKISLLVLIYASSSQM